MANSTPVVAFEVALARRNLLWDGTVRSQGSDEVVKPSMKQAAGAGPPR
jgi:hypothetical protein